MFLIFFKSTPEKKVTPDPGKKSDPGPRRKSDPGPRTPEQSRSVVRGPTESPWFFLFIFQAGILGSDQCQNRTILGHFSEFT